MTDSEKSNVRIQALLNELDRLQFDIKKKKVLIRLIVSVIVFAIIIVIAAFSNRAEVDNQNTLQVKRGNNAIVKERTPASTQVKYYELVFENLNQYPLARFYSEVEANRFQKEVKKLHLPDTYIHLDSLEGKERVLSVSSNYRYYIQFGIFKKKLISSLPDNMIYLQQLKDKDLYKYRLGPFSHSAKAKSLVKDLKLKDYLIVEVSN